MQKLQINIFNTDLEWMGAIDSVHSLIHRTSWHEMPSSELKVSRSAQGYEELQIGRILVVNNQLDKALIIEDMTSNLDDLYTNFNLISLKAMMNYRICHPSDSGTYAAKRQSEVMTGLVAGNLVTQVRDDDRYFQDDARTKNMLSVAANRIFGDTIDFSVDWKTGYLGDALTTVAKMFGKEANYPLGWNVIIKDDYSGFYFDVWHGTNKHINQTTLPPVVFSEEFGNVINASYEYSIKEWRNVVYMTYELEGSDTVSNIPVGNTQQGATVSFNRKEIIVSSSKKTLNEAKDEGYGELNKRPHIETFTAEILNNPNTMSTYKVDWTIGDVVTIQSREIRKDIKISVDAMITEVEEVYDNGEYTINATFGEGRLSLIQLIKNAIEQK
jgi:hypothetical protein